MLQIVNYIMVVQCWGCFQYCTLDVAKTTVYFQIYGNHLPGNYTYKIVLSDDDDNAVTKVKIKEVNDAQSAGVR